MSLTKIQEYCILEQNKALNNHQLNNNSNSEYNFVENVLKFLTELKQDCNMNKPQQFLEGFFTKIPNNKQFIVPLRNYFTEQATIQSNDGQSIPNSWNPLSNSFLNSKHRKIKLQASALKTKLKNQYHPSKFKEQHEIEQFQDPQSTQYSNNEDNNKLVSPQQTNKAEKSSQESEESMQKKMKQSIQKKPQTVNFQVIQKRNSDILQNLNYIRKESLKNIKNLNFDKRNSQFLLTQQGNFTLPTLQKRESMLKVIQRASKQIDPQVDLKPLQFNELFEVNQLLFQQKQNKLQCKNSKNYQDVSSSDDDEESIISEDEDFYRAIEEDEKSEKQQQTFLLKINVKKFENITFPTLIEENLQGNNDISITNTLVGKANLGEFSYQQEEARKMLGYNQYAIEPLNYKEQVEQKQRLGKLTLLPFYYYTKFGIKSNQIKCYDNKPYFRMKDFYNNSPERSFLSRQINQQSNEIYSLKASPIKFNTNYQQIEFKTEEKINLTNSEILSQQQCSQSEIKSITELHNFRSENLLCLEIGTLPLSEQEQTQTFYLKNSNQFQENIEKETFALTIKNKKLFSHLLQPESMKQFNNEPICDLIIDLNKTEFLQKLEHLYSLSPKNSQSQQQLQTQTERIFLRDLGTLKGTFIQLHQDNPFLLEPNSFIMLNQQAGFYVQQVINSNETIYDNNNNNKQFIQQFEEFDIMDCCENSLEINLEEIPREEDGIFTREEYELLKEVEKEFKQNGKKSEMLVKLIKKLQKLVIKSKRRNLKSKLVTSPAIKLVFIKLNHDPHYYEEKSTLIITHSQQTNENSTLIFGNDYLPLNICNTDSKFKLNLISQIQLPYKLQLEYNQKLKIWALINKGFNATNLITLDEVVQKSPESNLTVKENKIYNILRNPIYRSPFNEIVPGINTLNQQNCYENFNAPLEDFFSLHQLHEDIGPWIKINNNFETNYLKNITKKGEFIEIGCIKDKPLNISIMDDQFQFNLQTLKIQDVSNPNCLEFLSPQYPVSFQKKNMKKDENKEQFKIENFHYQK